MTRKKKKAAPKPQQPRPQETIDDEEQDIAATRRAIQPLLDAGLSHHRLASAAGTHPEDMRGFVDGRISLTPMLRARLRSQVDSLLDSLRPRG